MPFVIGRGFAEVQIQKIALPRTFWNVCLLVMVFYDPVNNEVMSSRSVNSGTVPGQA